MSDNIESITDPNLKQKISILSRIGGFIKKHPVFFIALAFWVVIWISGFEILFTYSILLSPGLVVIYGGLLLAHRVQWLKPFAAVAWAYPIACVLVVSILLGATGLATRKYVYRLGVDIQTPNGVISNSSMIEVIDGRNPIESMRRVHRGYLRIKGEAIFCDLGNGRNLLLTLAFKGDPSGTSTLIALPWLAAGINPSNVSRWSRSSGRFKISKDTSPILLTLTDTANPGTIKPLNPDNIREVFGKGYFIKEIWVEMTSDSYVSAGIKDKLAWLNTDNTGRYASIHSLKKIGVFSPYSPFIRD